MQKEMKNRGDMESKGGTETASTMSIDRLEPAKPPWRICADRYLLGSVVKSKHLRSSVFKPVYLDGGAGMHVKKSVRLQSAHFRDKVLQKEAV